MFCRCSAWSCTVYEKKESLHVWLQIRICSQWYCIHAELVVRKLHSFRLQHISCAHVTEESISILALSATNQISCDNELTLWNWRNTVWHCWKIWFFELHEAYSWGAWCWSRAEVAKLGGNPMLEKVLNELLDWKKDRDDKNPEKWGSCVPTSNVCTVYVWLAN
jgi:hypothetical protein